MIHQHQLSHVEDVWLTEFHNNCSQLGQHHHHNSSQYLNILVSVSLHRGLILSCH